MSDTDFVGLFEDLSRAENTADLSEGRMLRFLLRKVRPHVTPTELVVLMFIFDRTYTYGKVSEVISVEHFLNGVEWNGEVLAAPTGLKRSQLFDVLKRLCDNVIILRKTDKRSNRTLYMINPIWSPDFVLPSRNVTKRNITDQQVRKTGQGSPDKRTSLSGPPSAIEQEDSNMGNITGAAVPQSVTDLLSNTIAKHGAARDRQKAKGNATAYEKLWEDSYRAAYPEEQYFAWRVSDKAAFKRALQRGGVPATTVALFIDFVVSEFPSVVSSRFGWMRNPPSFPTPRFVIAHIETFYLAFKDKDDPNRKIRGAVARAAPAPVLDLAGLEASKKLEQELAAEKAARVRAERERDELKTEKVVARKAAARKLVLKRPVRTEEFGGWDD